MASGDKIRCFFLELHGSKERNLRRYGGPGVCPERGYHHAMVLIDVVAEDAPYVDDHPHDDPLWPKACACGYVFSDDDHWQVFDERLFVRRDTGEVTTLEKAPVGAMWYADWFENYRGPDGHCLVVRTPGGDWIVDMPATRPGGKPWTRTGTPPDVTAHPSICIGKDPPGDGPWKYHGWLKAGWLEEC